MKTKIVIAGLLTLLLMIGIGAVAISEYSSSSPNQEASQSIENRIEHQVPVSRSADDMSENDAISKAAVIAQKLGISSEDSIWTQLNKQAAYPNNVWSVYVGGKPQSEAPGGQPAPPDAQIQIDAKTGRVVLLANYKRHRERVRVPAELTTTQAVEAAKKRLQDLSLTDDNSAQLGTPELIDVNPSAPLEWSIKWYRTYHNIPYKNDWYMVDIDASTGELIGYSYRYRSLEPQSPDINLNESQAREAAEQFAKSMGLLDVSSEPGKLMIVNPNYLWSDAAMIDRVGVSAIAWVFKLSDKSEIWIGADNGKTLGGVQMQ